jgi:hypothetical protein
MFIFFSFFITSFLSLSEYLVRLSEFFSTLGCSISVDVCPFSFNICSSSVNIDAWFMICVFFKFQSILHVDDVSNFCVTYTMEQTLQMFCLGSL